MKFRHLVSYTHIRYLTVDYDVYRMSLTHFSHFSLITKLVSSLVLNFAFPCELHGFHVYKELWNPILNEKLDTIQEEIHAGWVLAALYDFLTGVEGRDLRKQESRKLTTTRGKPLPPVDPFEEICRA